MPTDRLQERIVAADYPSAMRHLQQLIMDSEACAKAYGKKSIFGGDKFEPAFEKFMTTLAICVNYLAVDGHVKDLGDAESGVEALNTAMNRLEWVYGNWPLGFRFWSEWYAQFRAKLDREQGGEHVC